MHKRDLQSEWAFYGGRLDTIGHLYLRGTKLPAKEPDVLFFILFTCGLLVDKKLSITGANFIHNNLDFSDESWYQILNWEEKRPFTFPCRVIPYRGYARSCLSSSIFFREQPVFRSGRMGFGFFSNKKFFDFCAGGAVFGLIETIYKVHSKEPKEDSDNMRRRLNAEQDKRMKQLFLAAALIQRLQLGPDLNRGNYRAISLLMYQLITKDSYPPIPEKDRAAYQPIIDRVYQDYVKSQEKRARAAMASEAEIQCGEDLPDADAHKQAVPVE